MRCLRKSVQQLKKRKSHVFLDFQQNVKKRKKGEQLVMQPLITQLPEIGTRKSRSPTSNISCSEVWTQETMQLRTVCDKCL